MPQREGLYITVGPAPVMVHFGRIPQGLLKSAGARRTACRRMPEDSDGLFASVMVPSSGRGGVHGKPGLGENPVTLECCNFTKREVSAHISAQVRGAGAKMPGEYKPEGGQGKKNTGLAYSFLKGRAGGAHRAAAGGNAVLSRFITE